MNKLWNCYWYIFSARRKLEDLTIGPVLTWTTEQILEHTNKLASIPGAKILFGGKELENHTIPKNYGAVYPTAVHVPIDKVKKQRRNNFLSEKKKTLSLVFQSIKNGSFFRK